MPDVQHFFWRQCLREKSINVRRRGHGFVRQVSLRTLCIYREVIVGVCFGEGAYRISKASMLYTRSRLY